MTPIDASTHSHGATDRLKAILDMLAAATERDERADPACDAAASEPRIADTLGADSQTAEASTVEETVREDGPRRRATLGQLTDALDERAYGILLLLLALPCCLPFIYILPQIVALPMLALCAQLALGRETPWLPRRLADREFSIAAMRGTVVKAERYVGWVERLSHSRLRGLSDGIGGRVVGALLLIPCASILVPLPLTNTTPGIAVAIAALGLIERDGLLILAGLILGITWVFLLIFLGAEAISLAKDWLLGLL